MLFPLHRSHWLDRVVIWLSMAEMKRRSSAFESSVTQQREEEVGRNEYTIKKQQQKPRKTTPTVCAAAETTSIWKWNQRYKRQTSGTEKKRNFCFLRVASDARVFFLCFLNIFNFPWFFLNAQGEGVDTLIHWLSPMTDESASLSTQRKKEA